MGQAAGGIFDDGIKLLQSGVLLLDCDFEIVAEKFFDSLGVKLNHRKASLFEMPIRSKCYSWFATSSIIFSDRRTRGRCYSERRTGTLLNSTFGLDSTNRQTYNKNTAWQEHCRPPRGAIRRVTDA
jgi:hypothetical protein